MLPKKKATPVPSTKGRAPTSSRQVRPRHRKDRSKPAPTTVMAARRKPRLRFQPQTPGQPRAEAAVRLTVAAKLESNWFVSSTMWLRVPAWEQPPPAVQSSEARQFCGKRLAERTRRISHGPWPDLASGPDEIRFPGGRSGEINLPDVLPPPGIPTEAGEQDHERGCGIARNINHARRIQLRQTTNHFFAQPAARRIHHHQSGRNLPAAFSRYCSVVARTAFTFAGELYSRSA